MNWNDLKQIVIPRPVQIMACFGLTLLLLVTVYWGIWTSWLFHITPLNDSVLREGLALQFTSQLAQLNQISLVRTIVIALFWGIVGLVAYVIYLAATNTVTEARNEVVIETEYTNKGTTKERIRPIILQLATALGLILALILTASLGLPTWLGWFENALLHGLTIISAAYLLGSLLGFVVNFYFLFTLGQVVFALD